MSGYDLPLIEEVSRAVPIPVVALGGAGRLAHLREAWSVGHASALAAGSLFVFHGSKRGVLINYPERSELVFSE
jgi:cyclase